MGKKRDRPDAPAAGAGDETVQERKKKEPKQVALDIGSADAPPAAGDAVPYIAPASVAKAVKAAKPVKPARQ
ncbi:MAG: hypothetical protein JW839_01950, partial [Candidatus Lokiarchaeota archaeon]|nr:hypothetical protein [Candidatus Lokiarchaeota archaeon]